MGRGQHPRSFIKWRLQLKLASGFFALFGSRVRQSETACLPFAGKMTLLHPRLRTLLAFLALLLVRFSACGAFLRISCHWLVPLFFFTSCSSPPFFPQSSVSSLLAPGDLGFLPTQLSSRFSFRLLIALSSLSSLSVCLAPHTATLPFPGAASASRIRCLALVFTLYHNGLLLFFRLASCLTFGEARILAIGQKVSYCARCLRL